MGKEIIETEAFVDAAAEVGVSALLKLIEAGSGKSLMIKIGEEVWEVSAKKVDK